MDGKRLLDDPGQKGRNGKTTDSLIDESRSQPESQVETDANIARIIMYLHQSSNGMAVPTEINKEKERIAHRLSGFDPKENQVWQEITNRFGGNIKQPELLSIAEVVSQNAGIKLDRDAKRRKSVLIKWFDENWALIEPYIGYVVLEEAEK